MFQNVRERTSIIKNRPPMQVNKGKDNTLIMCPGREGVGVGKKITDNHDTGLADPDLLPVFPFSE